MTHIVAICDWTSSGPTLKEMTMLYNVSSISCSIGFSNTKLRYGHIYIYTHTQ